jgi:hypothetical protein
MFTCTGLRHALLEWQKNKGVYLKSCKSKLKVDRPDRINYCNYNNNGGKNASWFAAMGRKLLISCGIAHTFTFLMNTWNTLPETYQQRVYNNTLATVKRLIKQVENRTPAAVISVEAAHVDNANFLDYVTSKVALQEPEIRSTDPHIPIENNCTGDEHHFGMPGGIRDYADEGDATNVSDVIATTGGPGQPATDLERFNLGSSDVNRYEGKDGDDVDVDEEEVASQADDRSTQTVEDRGHS